MAVLDLLTLVFDRGGGFGTVLLVVVLLRLRVSVTWSRDHGLKLGLRL